MSNLKKYYSNGKLLLTGEYLILDAALALAVPTKFGQDLKVKITKGKQIAWKSFDSKGEIWFETDFGLPVSKERNNKPIKETLRKILLEAKKRNPDFLEKNGFEIVTTLGFPKNWGLGSSSTLINNIAQWAKIDAFELLQYTMGGSGYDIACAQYNQPILYQLIDKKPKLKTIAFYPEFSAQLYFVYLNKKQQSSKEIVRYHSVKKDVNLAVKTVSEITNLLVKTKAIDDFEILIHEHEKLLSSILKIPTVQDLSFKDYFGRTKSLGAWGGDFILATGNDDTPKYFKKKGFETFLLYDEMVL